MYFLFINALKTEKTNHLILENRTNSVSRFSRCFIFGSENFGAFGAVLNNNFSLQNVSTLPKLSAGKGFGQMSCSIRQARDRR